VSQLQNLALLLLASLGQQADTSFMNNLLSNTIKISATLALLMLTSVASAQLEVSKGTMELTESSPRTTLRLTNSGADTLYVNLNFDHLLDPANDESKREPIDLLNNPKMLVLPQQLVLEAGQTKLVRVISAHSNVISDQVYRLNIVPFAGKPLLDANENKSVGVNILLGYRLLVLVRPETISPKVDFDRKVDSVVFRNSGNTSVLLREIEACVANDTTCEKLSANRLYPGEVLDIKLPGKLRSSDLKIKTRQSVQFTENIVEY